MACAYVDHILEALVLETPRSRVVRSLRIESPLSSDLAKAREHKYLTA